MDINSQIYWDKLKDIILKTFKTIYAAPVKNKKNCKANITLSYM